VGGGTMPMPDIQFGLPSVLGISWVSANRAAWHRPYVPQQFVQQLLCGLHRNVSLPKETD